MLGGSRSAPCLRRKLSVKKKEKKKKNNENNFRKKNRKKKRYPVDARNERLVPNYGRQIFGFGKSSSKRVKNCSSFFFLFFLKKRRNWNEQRQQWMRERSAWKEEAKFKLVCAPFHFVVVVVVVAVAVVVVDNTDPKFPKNEVISSSPLWCSAEAFKYRGVKERRTK